MMIVGILNLCFGLVTAQDYMTSDMTPDLGAETDSVYQPGTPGGQWSADEVKTTRQRIFQMIHPDWDVKKVSKKGSKFGSNCHLGYYMYILKWLKFKKGLPKSRLVSRYVTPITFINSIVFSSLIHSCQLLSPIAALNGVQKFE